jgi:hypothetical protein
VSASDCPTCNRPLPPSVVNGQSQAVVRCEGCQTLLLWSNGRVMRSARATTPTMMGLPVSQPGTPKREADAPLPSLQPEGDSTRHVVPALRPATPLPPAMKPVAAPSTTTAAPSRTPTQPLGHPVAAKPAPAGTAAPTTPVRRDPTPAPPSRTVAPTTPVRRDPTPAPPSRTTTAAPKESTAAPARPVAAPAARRDLTPAPTKGSPSQSQRIVGATPVAPSALTPSAAQRVAAGDDKPIVTAAVAEVPTMAGGPMVDPSAWFAESTSDVVPPERLPPLPAGLGQPAAAPFEIEAPDEFDASLTPISGTIAKRALDLEPPPAAQPAAKRSPATIRGGTPGVLGAASRPSPAVAANVPVAMPERTSPGGPVRSGDATGPANVPTLLADSSDSGPISSLMQESKTVKGKAALLPEPAPSARAVTERPEASPRNVVAPARAAEPSPRQPVATPARAAESSPRNLVVPAAEPAARHPVAAARLPEPAAAAEAPRDADLFADLAVPRPLVSEPSVPALPPPPEHAVDGVPRALRDDAAEATRPLVRGAGMPRRQRILAAAGGALVVFAIVSLAIFRKHGEAADRPSPRPAVAPAVAAAPPSPAPAAPAAPPPVAAVPPPVAVAVAPPSVAAEPTAPAPAEATPEAPKSGRRHTLGGKKVVLEYDPKPTSVTPSTPSAPTPMGEDPNVVARAREAYHRGNNKLFAGDTSAALELYRESIRIYPGYVAGYRGLGLGYEAAGNTQEALKAFHTYVRTVPGAVDTGLIRKRIDRLEAAK